jgi:hypothetical protein
MPARPYLVGIGRKYPTSLSQRIMRGGGWGGPLKASPFKIVRALACYVRQISSFSLSPRNGI